MRKLEKLTLNKANIEQSDILRKKELKNIFGGRRCDEDPCTVSCGNKTVSSPYADCSELLQHCDMIGLWTCTGCCSNSY